MKKIKIYKGIKKVAEGDMGLVKRLVHQIFEESFMQEVIIYGRARYIYAGQIEELLEKFEDAGQMAIDTFSIEM